MHQVPLGQGIPVDTPHAISVSLPTWSANVGYEEGEQWVLSRMKCGYPRFFVHPVIEEFANDLCPASQECLLFPSAGIARECLEFMRSQKPAVNGTTTVVAIEPTESGLETCAALGSSIAVYAVCYDPEHALVARSFWQHTGEGVSTRRAEFCRRMFHAGQLKRTSGPSPVHHHDDGGIKGPRRYRHKKDDSLGSAADDLYCNHDSCVAFDEADVDSSTFVEERFGRNCTAGTATKAKALLCRRIADAINSKLDASDGSSSRLLSRLPGATGCSEEDVILHPTGMSSIYNTHQMLLRIFNSQRSICFGFPYVDTLKILEKWGPGCLFYGEGAENDLDDLEQRLARGERYQALFCEFPGNPLLRSPNLRRIRQLADRYDFAVVVDETIGNFLNVHVFTAADVVVSSLTKVFSGDSNVMGGSLILNPLGKYYRQMKTDTATNHEDHYWAEDAIYMERNSRDYAMRIKRINHNAEVITRLLESDDRVKHVYYPLTSNTRQNYDCFRKTNGGYGGLLSATFNTTREAAAFYDNLDIAKGPSLGTNFTLSSPYTLLAHYNELDWAASFGVDVNLVRISVGLEDADELVTRFRAALDAVSPVPSTVP